MPTCAVAYDAIGGMISHPNDPSARILMPAQGDALVPDLEDQGIHSLGLAEVLRLGIDQRSYAIIVIAHSPRSPAVESRLRTGDVIEAIDGFEAVGLAVHEVVALIGRGSGEKAVLRIERSGRSREIHRERTRRWTPSPSAEYRRVKVP